MARIHPDRELLLCFSDGQSSPAAVFGAAHAQRCTVLVLPAMGVPASYYHEFCVALAARGLGVALVDLRGQGRSSVLARRGDRYDYRDLIDIEIPEMLAQLRSDLQVERLVVLGHSLGGQLATLACARGLAVPDGLVLVAAGTAWQANWRGRARLGYRLLIGAIALLATLWPHYPGRLLGFGGDQARAFMRDWLGNARHGRYPTSRRAPAAPPIAAPPTLSLCIDGDVIAPTAANADLLGRLPPAAVETAVLRVDAAWSAWRRHFLWAKRPQPVVDRTVQWLQQRGLQ